MPANAPIFELRKGAERYCFQPLPGAGGELVTVWRPDMGALTTRDVSVHEARQMWREMLRVGWRRAPDGFGTPPYHHDFRSRNGSR